MAKMMPDDKRNLAANDKYGVDQYRHWRMNLDGQIKEWHEKDGPQPGFYRIARKDGSVQPVSIWRNSSGNMQVKIGSKNLKPIDKKGDDAHWKTFLSCCEHPIEHELFESVMAGERWPDETADIDLTPEAVKDALQDDSTLDVRLHTDAPGIGHNEPPDEHVRLHYEIGDVSRAIEEALAGDLKTKDDADRIANLRDKANDLRKKAESLRKLEAEPWDKGKSDVQGKWLPMLTMAKEAADSVRKPLQTLIDAIENIKKKALQAASPEMSKDEIEEASKTRVGGRMGKRTSNRKKKVAVIEDYDALIEELKTYDEMRELAQKIADKVVRAGGSLPGVSVSEVKIAV